MNANRVILHQMAIDAWSAGAAVSVACVALEAVERGFVSRFFNLLWLLLFMAAATFAVLATHPGAGPEQAGHRYPKAARSLLQLGSVALAGAAWFLLPASLSVVWRSIAAGGMLVASLLAWPALSKNE